LAEEAREVFDRHLGACPNCVTYLEQFRATIAAGKRACADDDAAAMVPEELIQAILQARKA
jgi:anti-sigma factor RsiW